MNSKTQIHKLRKIVNHLNQRQPCRYFYLFILLGDPIGNIKTKLHVGNVRTWHVGNLTIGSNWDMKWFLNSCCSKWGFGGKWGSISSHPYFGLCITFLYKFWCFLKAINCVAKQIKVGCTKLKGIKVCITRCSQNL